MVLDFPMIPGIDQSVALACKEFAHCDSTSADGSSTYTGSSGWSVVDTYSCGKASGGCGLPGGYGGGSCYGDAPCSWSGAQTGGTTSLAENTAQLGTYTASDGTVYTGDGFTVTDSYTCKGDCGGYTVADTYSHAATNGTTQLGTYTASDGTVYTGDGFTVTDSYTCKGDCGGFSVADTYSHGAPIEGPVMAPSHALAAPVMTPIGPVESAPKSVTVRATPAHLVMTMHALTFGILTASSKAVAGQSKDFSQDFKSAAADGASTMTPVGAFVLRKAFE